MISRNSHLSQEMLQRFLRTELNRRETHVVVRHLLTRCQHCLRILQEAEEATVLKLVPTPRGGTGSASGQALGIAWLQETK